MASMAAAFEASAEWPLPGQGQTFTRWRELSALAERDLVLARMVEAHADAVAILAEIEQSTIPPGSHWGVWAAEGAAHPLSVQQHGSEVTLHGEKAWCSGATLLSHALVTACRGDALQLCAVDLRQVEVAPGPDLWATAGMKAADTRSVCFDGAQAHPVGPPAAYLERPGFWIGGIGVAACWYGGAVALAAPLRNRVRAGSADPHTCAHLGAVDVLLGTAGDVLRAAASDVDEHPEASHARLARRVRGAIASTATAVSDHVGRALGPAPLATDAAHAQRVADLAVYIRQDHAEKDLAALGQDVAATDADWSL